MAKPLARRRRAYNSTLVDSGTVIKALERAGWRLVRVTGSHHHFRHESRPGLVTVAHPRKDVPVGTLRSIERQAGERIRD
jgi:predicted RNA binding protein YcfA (HicA-like mRNA interferase family)